MTKNTLLNIALVSTLLALTGCAGNHLHRDAAQSNVGKIYTFESGAAGFNTKNYFYDNGEEVIAFDTQFTPELARQSIAFLRTKTDRPISTVVITHPNPDKFNGMGEFQKLGAKVIASRATAENMPGVHAYKKYYFVKIAKMFSEDTYPGLGAVDETFEKREDLRLRNGEVIQLRELSSPGVSTNQTIAFIPAVEAVMVGDLVHSGVHAWLEGGIVGGKATPTIQGWISDLKEIAQLLRKAPRAIVYGGRGMALPVADAIPAQISYLEKSDRLVSDYVSGLGEKKSELTGENAGTHYVKLQDRFEAVFPGIDLGYMIQYGVYGLVNSKL